MDYTYSRWDGSQGADGIDLEMAMQAMADDLIADGNFEAAVAKFENRVIADAPPASEVNSTNGALARLRVDSAPASVDDMSSDLPALLHALTASGFPSGLPCADFEMLREEPPAFCLQPVLGHSRDPYDVLLPESLDSLAELLRGLNDIASEPEGTKPESFDTFMSAHEEMFPGADSCDELLHSLQARFHTSQSLIRSLSPVARAKFEQSLHVAWQHERIVTELESLCATLSGLDSRLLPPFGYRGRDERSMLPPDGLGLFGRPQSLGALERGGAPTQNTGGRTRFDPERNRPLPTDEDRDHPADVPTLTQRLESAGYASVVNGDLELTARGMRTLAEKALEDIFRQMKQDRKGDHAPLTHGEVEPSGASRPYEFGNRFLPDINRTVFNAIKREGGRTPVRLKPHDFEVVESDSLSQAATVLMLDISRSMPLRGCLLAAKKVALTLQLLIQTRFPQDHLYLTVFSDRARQVRPDELCRLQWGGSGHGTNMQHGLMLARRLLGRHASGNRQIVLVTDGEPTAYLEDGQVFCAYPPTTRIFEETLREVRRCTQDGIVINTFMLDNGRYLVDFVERMARINRGRAFFATPDRLANYVLLDYVARRGGH